MKNLYILVPEITVGLNDTVFALPKLGINYNAIVIRAYFYTYQQKINFLFQKSNLLFLMLNASSSFIKTGEYCCCFSEPKIKVGLNLAMLLCPGCTRWKCGLKLRIT